MNINAWKFAILNTWNWIFQNIPKIHFLCTIYGIMKWLASAWLILISKSASYPNRNANQNWRASFLLCEGRLRLCQKLTFYTHSRAYYFLHFIAILNLHMASFIEYYSLIREKMILAHQFWFAFLSEADFKIDFSQAIHPIMYKVFCHGSIFENSVQNCLALILIKLYMKWYTPNFRLQSVESGKFSSI